MTGYKATNADMICSGVGANGKRFSQQYELGKWYECEGELELCKNGFHFCVHPSGVWSYYPGENTRVFVVEAEDVLDTPYEPGAALKKVARRIRLVREITVTGDSNTGYSNTGDRNTGDSNTGYRNTGYGNTGDSNTGYSNTGYRNTGYRNTGDRNTGDRNTGDSNTGDSNTGDRNTGDSNTGDRNTGDRNTGYRNTGDSNTGYSNTGDSNTGDSNTGDSNTGYGNAANNSPDFFSVENPKVKSFDIQTDLTAEEYQTKYPQYWQLCDLLHRPAEIDFSKFSQLPGITKEKLTALHRKHLAAKT